MREGARRGRSGVFRRRGSARALGSDRQHREGVRWGSVPWASRREVPRRTPITRAALRGRSVVRDPGGQSRAPQLAMAARPGRAGRTGCASCALVEPNVSACIGGASRGSTDAPTLGGFEGRSAVTNEETLAGPVKTCRPEDTLAQVAQMMSEHAIGRVSVIADDGRVISVITDLDIAIAASIEGRKLSDLTVQEAMSR